MDDNNVVNILLVIDLQEQFRDEKGKYEKCVEYVKRRFNDSLVLGTVFQNMNGSMFENHLDWHGCKNECVLAYSVEYPYHRLIIKNGYGIDSSNEFDESVMKLLSETDKSGDVKFSIVGCDADACVLASAFFLWDRGYDFEILSDYIYTTAKEFDVDFVIKLMRRNFGDCVI